MTGAVASGDTELPARAGAGPAAGAGSPEPPSPLPQRDRQLRAGQGRVVAHVLRHVEEESGWERLETLR